VRYGAKFCVPPSYYEGICSLDYCSWWTKISIPYLSWSVEKVHQTTTNKKELLRETVYIIDHLHPLYEFVLRAVIVVPRRSLQYHPLKKEKPRFLEVRPQKKKNKMTPAINHLPC